jgi:hypothetical protein
MACQPKEQTPVSRRVSLPHGARGARRKCTKEIRASQRWFPPCVLSLERSHADSRITQWRPFLSLTSSIILANVTEGRREQKRLLYLQIPRGDLLV